MLAIGCDHGGYELKKEILAWLASKNIEYRDFGCHSTEAVNYPVYAKAVAESVVSGECEKGILVCGTGIEATRLHNDANVLALGGRVVGAGLAIKIVETFLNTPFSEEQRHKDRIAMIED